MGVKLDQSDPKKVVVSVSHWRHWLGFLLSVSFVALSFYFILYYGDDQAFSGLARLKRIPSTWVFVAVPLAFLPFVMRNLGWSLRGEKVLIDGTTADIYRNGKIVAEFKDVVAVALHGDGGLSALVLTLKDGREVPVAQGRKRPPLESAGRVIATFLKRPMHMSG